MNVLIVESRPESGLLWQRHHERQGMSGARADAQDDAVDHLARNGADIIVLDLVLTKGSALAVAALSLYFIRRVGAKTFGGKPITIDQKAWGPSRLPGARYWIGGTLFGLGWGLLGACPGPMFALLGTGLRVIVVALLSAMAGTWAYAALRDRLPH